MDVSARAVELTTRPLCRHKDRVSLSDVLDGDEVLRFDRAIYRYWLYCEMVERCAFVEDRDEDEDEEDDYDDSEEPEEKAMRTGLIKVIGELDTKEMYQVYHAATFCQETARWQGRAYATQCKCRSLSKTR